MTGATTTGSDNATLVRILTSEHHTNAALAAERAAGEAQERNVRIADAQSKIVLSMLQAFVVALDLRSAPAVAPAVRELLEAAERGEAPAVSPARTEALRQALRERYETVVEREVVREVVREVEVPVREAVAEPSVDAHQAAEDPDAVWIDPEYVKAYPTRAEALAAYREWQREEGERVAKLEAKANEPSLGVGWHRREDDFNVYDSVNANTSGVR